MIVPYKFAISLLILVPLTLWFVGTCKYDFMTPQDIPANELRPGFASPVNPEIADAVTSPARLSKRPEQPAIPEIDPGDFQISPGLDEYQTFAHLGAPSLLQLAQKLQNAGQVQRAVLAYERVLDSTASGGSSQEKAQASITTLKTSLPRWNPDPQAAKPLRINLSTARDADSLLGTITTLTELIAASSGNQAQPEFVILKSDSPTLALPALPIALWLTISGEDPEIPSLTVVTITPPDDSTLNDITTHALYRLVSRRLESIGGFTLPPEFEEGENPENALVNKVTRLGWKRILATPFQSLEAGPPPSSLRSEELTTEEEDEEVSSPEKIQP